MRIAGSHMSVQTGSDVIVCGVFPSTHWSLVREAGHGSGEAKQIALAAVVRRYLSPMRAHLIKSMRLDPDAAEDLLQCFLTDKVVSKDVVRQAEQSRGRFRSFLLVTLERFVISRLRYERAQVRRPLKQSAFDETMAVQGDSPDPAETFDVAWAREVLAQAVEDMRRQCTASARPDIWGVFEHRVLAPSLEGATPVPYQQLVQQFNLVSPTQASNVLVTGNRMFMRALRATVGRYARDESEIDREIADLRRILASGGARSHRTLT